jgi:hypothetical protein
VVQQILGCLTFDWRDRARRALLSTGVQYTWGPFASFAGQNSAGPRDATMVNLAVWSSPHYDLFGPANSPKIGLVDYVPDSDQTFQQFAQAISDCQQYI